MSGSVTIATSPQPAPTEKESLGQRIPMALSNAAERLVNLLKVNSVSEQVRRGRRPINKRRTVYSKPLAELANVYFRMTSISIRFWVRTEDWRRWGSEVVQHVEWRSVSRTRLRLALALAFLNAYDNAAVIAQLKNELAVPTGMAWI